MWLPCTVLVTQSSSHHSPSYLDPFRKVPTIAELHHHFSLNQVGMLLTSFHPSPYSCASHQFAVHLSAVPALPLNISAT